MDDEKVVARSKRSGFPRMNGWRRIGVVLYAVYCLFSAALLWEEIGNQKGRLFFDKAPRNISVQEADGDGQKLKPWEKDWGSGAETQQEKSHFVPIDRFELSAQKLFVGFLGFPLLTWLFFELAAAAIRWIIAGFRNNPASNPAQDGQR